MNGLHGKVWTGEAQESRFSPQPHLQSTNRVVSSSPLQVHPPTLSTLLILFNRSAIDCLETGGTWAAWQIGRGQFLFFLMCFNNSISPGGPILSLQTLLICKFTPLHQLQMFPMLVVGKSGRQSGVDLQSTTSSSTASRPTVGRGEQQGSEVT